MKHKTHKRIVKKVARKAYHRGKMHGKSRHPRSSARYMKRGGIQFTG